MEKKIKDIIDRYLHQKSNQKDNEFIEQWSNKILQEETINLQYKQTINRRLIAKIEKAKRQLIFRKRIQKTAIAAIVILLPFVSVLYKKSQAGELVYYANTDLEIQLKDQSVIYLEKGGELIVSKDFNEKNRALTLSGTATFEVTKNKNLPFVVSSKNLTTKVLGTNFTVSDSNNSSTYKVKVNHGKVSVNNLKDQQLFVLHPTDSLVWNNNNLQYNTLENKVFFFDFHQASLAQVIDELGLYYQTDIQLNSSSLNTIKVNGKYPKTDLFAILKSICFLNDLAIETNNESILIKKIKTIKHK